jgi:hypothetical protein
LPDPSQAWPWVVGRELSAAIGDDVDVVDVPVAPVGPGAVPRAVNALDENKPDIAVFAFGGYHFIVSTVGERVRRRYGKRAYRLFRKIELLFEDRTANAEGRPARLNRFGRWLARKVIGAEPYASEEEATGIQLEIMRQMAQREGLISVMMFAPPLGESIERDNPGANARLAKYRKDMTEVARGYRFLIADCLPGFEEAAKRGGLRTSDGVHKGAAGHRIQADAIMKALIEAPSPLAAAIAAAPSS